jgi:predicted TIM-barrel fold metal-dependent hydrolase
MADQTGVAQEQPVAVEPRYVVHSAETYVHEPADLWTSRLDNGLRSKAFRLVQKDDRFVWVSGDGDGKPVAGPGESARFKEDGTTAEKMVGYLDKEGITGAVLFPSIAQRGYAQIIDSAALTDFFEPYNEWILGLAADSPKRLRGLPLMNVDDPSEAARKMGEYAKRGAAGFLIPMACGEGRRYDMPQFEALWAKANELKLPLLMMNSSNRHSATDAADKRKEALSHSVAAKLSHRATNAFAVRRSITAILYTGAIERYPDLRIGLVGFGASWAPFAMIRADEVYQVRPERTGPPTRVPPNVASEEIIKQTIHLREGADKAIKGDDRSGTTGMAPEGVGFYFKDGDQFSDHFRKGLFLTFNLRGKLSVRLRHYLGAEGLMWGHRYPSLSDEIPLVQERLNEALERLNGDDKTRLVETNAAKIFKF